MKVTLNAPLSLGNKPYPKGTQEMPDHLFANEAFKQHVQAGNIQVHPRDKAAQGQQAQRDARALSKSVSSKETVNAAIAARAKLTPTKSVRGSAPQLSQAAKAVAADAAAAPAFSEPAKPADAAPAPSDDAPKGKAKS